MRLKPRRGGLTNKWAAVLEELVLPASPWTTETLLRAYVRQMRGAKLVLSRDANVVYPGGPSGMWIPGDGVDLVWAHPAAHGVQYAHILGHELGHMVNGDQPDPVGLLDTMRLLQGMCSHISPELMEAAMCRTDGADARERAAEDFGYFAETWAAKEGPKGATLLVANMRESLNT
ncbi:hypothetical protein [Streptomyces griseoaurantiacus]|uniref:hypothetical protein n=1 Tax=Streptomyces griseoaurantiacus TaxID=68213 RepID=UPI0036C451F3